ncbi:DUF2785 domain-containing protein [Pseudalkalibacillus hwajinpoensis]|uniref:DUF2785 domain-containing protein n=1 Tax=Guptibacillus hwajinpoensis TaxID=208199 RepID=A0A4V5Q1Z6_9BACL|nr:DUF2785 domain-containing protein [Pseudalkalibacillus hwajinpoensis]TKD72178.1 DUF2785 domain-containing protein [Pseudalkalibacillus hwajinpoensis]
MELKTELKQLNFEYPDQVKQVDLDLLLESMLNEIGSTDPELRDELIFGTFAELVMKDYLTVEQMNFVMTACLDNQHVFYRIGEKGTDAVFTRSFSILVVALLLEKDREVSFLSDGEATKAIDRCVRYLQEEQDIRGYVEEKGWAHSIAHGADAFAEAIKHRNFGEERVAQCLETIHLCLFKEGVYVDDEDERLLLALEALLDRGVSDAVLVSWIVGIEDELELLFNNEGYSVPFFHTKGNVMHFLKSCYFRLLFRDCCVETRGTVENVVKKWTKKFYG